VILLIKIIRLSASAECESAFETNSKTDAVYEQVRATVKLSQMTVRCTSSSRLALPDLHPNTPSMEEKNQIKPTLKASKACTRYWHIASMILLQTRELTSLFCPYVFTKEFSVFN